jgi:hypothetical protein
MRVSLFPVECPYELEGEIQLSKLPNDGQRSYAAGMLESWSWSWSWTRTRPCHCQFCRPVHVIIKTSVQPNKVLIFHVFVAPGKNRARVHFLGRFRELKQWQMIKIHNRQRFAGAFGTSLYDASQGKLRT